jgi:hypothetical protein
MWQSYVPTLALLVSDDFGKDITWVGWLYLAFVGTSIIGSMSLHQHLRCLTPYTVRAAARRQGEPRAKERARRAPTTRAPSRSCSSSATRCAASLGRCTASVR